MNAKICAGLKRRSIGERRLASIMFIDMADYSALARGDERAAGLPTDGTDGF